mmetsp:Transcript_18568/g.25651  ORF Transcript_18568/g.25651 Transcript_18568/m.25651 type:complete len:415 (-) Transcript_18568:523-1767(-)
MGCCCCRRESLYVRYSKLSKWKAQFEALKLREREVEKIFNIFKKVDVDGSGSIELVELLVHIDLDRTTFTERIFSIFDEDGSGEIDFREFVLSLWNYCTLSKSTLDLFAFDLYDVDSSGYLSVAEIDGMLKDVYGKNAMSNQYARGVSSDLKAIEADGDLDVDAFKQFARNHPALLFPAFLMQSTLQRRILGQRFWHNHANRRIEISKGKFIPIAKFMDIHMDKSLFNNFVDTVDDPRKKVNSQLVLLVETTGTHAFRKSSAQPPDSPAYAPKKSKPSAKETVKNGRGNAVAIVGDKSEESYNYGSSSSEITGTKARRKGSFTSASGDDQSAIKHHSAASSEQESLKPVQSNLLKPIQQVRRKNSFSESSIETIQSKVVIQQPEGRKRPKADKSTKSSGMSAAKVRAKAQTNRN